MSSKTALELLNDLINELEVPISSSSGNKTTVPKSEKKEGKLKNKTTEAKPEVKPAALSNPPASKAEITVNSLDLRVGKVLLIGFI